VVDGMALIKCTIMKNLADKRNKIPSLLLSVCIGYCSKGSGENCIFLLSLIIFPFLFNPRTNQV
jgi:ABC-type antimicrobial peptide transport system permease subunit